MIDYNKVVADTTNAVVLKVGNPVNDRVVLATLESFGIRDSDVLSDYGFPSINELAQHIFLDLKSRNPKDLKNEPEMRREKKSRSIPVSDYLWIKSKLFTKYYPLGLFHLMPVFIQIITIVFFGYSLWTYLGFNIVQSTSVVFGVILGLTISGGYIQVLGRQSSFYWHHQEYYKAKVVIDKMTFSGIKGLLVSFAALLVINMFFNFYPFSFVLITMIYAFLIGLLLLVMAPFHSIKQRWFNSLVILISTVLALTLSLTTSIHIYITHWIGIGLAIVLCRVYLLLFFKKKIGLNGTDAIKPRTVTVIYRNYHYFFYGILVYLFIFLDRLLAWSADATLTHNYLFLYEKNYEIGMDLAIIIFFLLSGVLEYSIASFSKFLDIRQKSTSLIYIKSFNMRMHTMYKGHITLLLGTAFLSTLFIYFFVTKSWGYQANFGEALDPISIRVCIIGGFGYLFMTWGMLNSLYLFLLNKPQGALKAITIACVINFTIGFFSSRVLSYEYSSVGMLIGAFVFMILTSKHTMSYFKKLDYHYYASY
ncbi:hypothetical protein EJ994_12060 [Maribacter sp. MJ134]|uniref:hypothetical protein n=1 Tax=Maribacter sp. MJ134 TaxID=2496865 RepID=UPI000F830146|nr:hypothetical protein [Maribacter sp. MJ134]AZQ59503.1 hypothetical protein EJ994_12060 [Maribacter sp. MJ134]